MTKKTKYQVPSREINRREIKNAPYNPRTIDEAAKKALRKNIKTVGLMGGIVVNFQTMHLVSGHQRLEQLDTLEGTEDYTLRVEEANLTDKQEKEQNIFMNNAKVQGRFDTEKLALIASEIDFGLAGLDDFDKNLLLPDTGGDLGGLDLGIEEKPQKKGRNSGEKKETMSENPNFGIYEEEEEEDAHREVMKEKKRKALEKINSDFEEGDTYAVIEFPTHAEKAAFMQRFGMLPADRYIDGPTFSDNIERID